MDCTPISSLSLYAANSAVDAGVIGNDYTCIQTGYHMKWL